MSEKVIRNIAVFCGSSSGAREEYRESALELGAAIAGKGFGLVYGGGGKGLMGVVARAVRENGGRVIGVLPKAMDVPSVRKDSVETELMIVNGMHERKETMYSLADAFIAMPGGIGTLEEIAEIYIPGDSLVTTTRTSGFSIHQVTGMISLHSLTKEKTKVSYQKK